MRFNRKQGGRSLFRNIAAIGVALGLGGLVGCSSDSGSMAPLYPYPPHTTSAAPARTAPPAAATTAPRPAGSPAAARPPVAASAPVARGSSVLGAGVSSGGYRLKGGDPVVITLRGIPGMQEQDIEVQVDENGLINLPYINQIKAGGKTATEVEQSVQTAYIQKQIYKYITVNVVIPARSYYVRGEVRSPGRFPLVSRVTIVQAVAAAGGFTEFANQSKVEILRGSDRIRVNVRDLEQNPERDRELEAGDVIIVYRSVF
jgi:polysaccharide biosynthesis/export protein VpsN